MRIKLHLLDVASRASGYVNAWADRASRQVDRWDMKLGSAYERERHTYVVRLPKS